MNERQLCNHFSGFWLQSLPNLESITRAFNLGPEREHPPLRSVIDPDRRDVVSETAFRLVGLTLTGAPLRSSEAAQSAFLSASEFLLAAPDVGREQIVPLDDIELAEVRQIADRTRSFLRQIGPGIGIEFMPAFVGHGGLERCFGDFSVGNTLVEVKCVDRTFRSSDLRQLLVYSALKYLENRTLIANLVVYNPLRGTSITVGVDELIFSSSGKSPEEFFYEFSYLLASGQLSR